MSIRPHPSEDAALRFDGGARVRAVLVGSAFIGVFWTLLDFIPPGLGEMVHRWVYESDWSHGPIIPLFSAYLVYTRWEQVRRAPVRHTWVGLVILLAALALYQYALWGMQFGTVRPLAMLLCLLGVIIFLRGLPVMRHVWVPWLYLLFAVPLPKGIYFMITDPLRRIAATVATSVLGFATDLHIERRGSVIEFFYNGNWDAIDVADACSGMRSTMTLCALGVAVTFLSNRAWWQRLIMIGSCVPIAVFCNFIRVTTTCALYIYVDPRFATGNYHLALGLVVLAVAFGIFSLLGWVLNNLTTEDPEPAAEMGGHSSARGGADGEG